jgi:prepilin-type N-terminal cleavage/methylation domain-containing protein
MKKPTSNPLTRRGFTILELLIVISIIAIIATLATGAAIKSMKQSRIRRIDAMAKGLEIALANYRAQENAWPFDLSDCVQDTKDRSRYWIHGENNAKAFQKLYHGGGGESTTVYLDAGAYLTRVSGKRMPLRTALNLRRTDAPLGYPLPENTSRFAYYCLCFNPLTDTVKVVRQDVGHKSAEGVGFTCPDWINQK